MVNVFFSFFPFVFILMLILKTVASLVEGSEGQGDNFRTGGAN